MSTKSQKNNDKGGKNKTNRKIMTNRLNQPQLMQNNKFAIAKIDYDQK